MKNLDWFRPSIDRAFEIAASNAENSYLPNNAEINAIVERIKILLPKSESHLLFRLEDLINDRVYYVSRETYLQGFMDAYKVYK